MVLLLPRQTGAFENLIQAQGEVRKDLPARPLHFAQPDWGYYHRTNHLHREITHLASTCRHARAQVDVASADSRIPSSFLLNGGGNRATMNGGGGSDVEKAMKERDADLQPSAADGLLYITLERGDERDGTEDTSSQSDGNGAGFQKHGLVELFRRRRRGFRVKNVTGRDNDATTVMFVFGEEGRDLITSEVALRIVQRVCGGNLSGATSSSGENIGSSSAGGVIPAHTRVVLVPVANPDGRRISEMGRRCDRTNARDVDVDRNWPSFWSEAPNALGASADTTADTPRRLNGLREAVARHFVGEGSIDDGSSDFQMPSAGSQPLSEPETRALKALVESLAPSAYVALRTGALALTTPWDCKPNALQPEVSRRLHNILQPVAAGHCTRCRTGPLYNVTGRAKCGTAVDHVFGAMNVPFVSAWHMYDVHAPRGDCFRRHNPTSHARFERVVDNWMHAALNFSTAVRNWVVLERHAGVSVAEQNASRSATEASERRARALADGAPDPESDEDTISADGDFHHSHGLPLGDPQRASVNFKHGNPFAWVLSRKQPYAAHSPHGSERRADSDGDAAKVSWANGWFGVSAALAMFLVCLFVAKHYVFRVTPSKMLKKSRFLSRGPIKNA